MARTGVELTPDDAHVHIALGSVFIALRRHDDGIAEAEHAIRLFPNYAHGLFELGWYLQYAGRAAESLSYFDRAVRLDPHHADLFLHFMAQAYFQLERYDETAELLRRRLVRNPRSDSSRMLLAACYGYLDKHDEARKVWAEIREINPDFSIEQRRQVLPYKNPKDFELIATGLLKAGISD
jgi:tetratricopeptide (TPR) repeat protein